MLAGVLPVSGLALGAYLAMLVASLFIGPATEVSIRRLTWRAMLVLAGSVAGSAVWFTIIQKWVIGDFCIYCMTIHITGLLLAALIFWRAIKEFDEHSNDILLMSSAMVKNVSPATPKRIIRPLSAMGLALIGLFLAGILAAFQVGFSSSSVYHDGESQDNLPAVDYHDVPMVGSPDAPYVVTLLFDYQCSHCQKIHFMLNEAIRRYSGKIAFALCPAPLNTHCNPYVPRDVDAFKNSCELAKIGMAVWVASREAFPAFENWMFTFESGDSWHPRSLETVRAKAVELVGQAKFDAALSDTWIGKYMQTCIRIYGLTIRNGKGGIPKLIFGSRWVIPEPYNADDFIMILQKSLSVPKP
jgi:protein-disulfide isomerase